MSELCLVGCDISRNKLDFYCKTTDEYFVVENSKKGLNVLTKWVKNHKFDSTQVCIAYEHTGLYGKRLSDFCFKNNYKQYAIPGLEIKKSMGLTRGKDDNIDAKRICHYLFEKHYKLSSLKQTKKELEELSRLKSLREKLVTDKGGYEARLKEEKKALDLKESNLIVKAQKQIINTISKQLKKIESQIEHIINSCNSIKNNYHLLMTVPSIGPINALEMIVVTANFTKFTDPRKFASYCGVAPFPNSSGKHKGTPRTSPYANKKCKSLLDMAAKNAITYDKELKLYYERKVREGKIGKSVRNAVRFKLITRMFAVVRKQQEFVKKYYNNLEN